MYTILIYAIIAVFIGGLMVGRTPEYLGKKIQATEVKLAGLGTLVMPITVLVVTAIAVVGPRRAIGPENAGPHGFSEILYALTSQGNNNGSAFGGPHRQHPLLQHHRRHRHAHRALRDHDPGLALGGVLAAKNMVAAGAGTFRTDKPMFVGLLDRRHHHRRRPDLLPRRLPRSDRRAASVTESSSK